MTTAADIIKAREGFRLVAYTCPAGIWTIGYGHTGPEVHEGLTITQGQAEVLLQSDLLKFETHVRQTCPESTPGQFAAMTSLCYNIGPDAFARSSVARLHNAKRYAEAGQAFALWNKGGGKVLPGLVARRAEEARVYLSDLPVEAVELVTASVAEGEAPLSQSRSINGQAIAGAMTAGSIGASAIQDNHDTIQQAQDTLSTLAPYYHWAGVAFAAVALGGLAWGIYARVNDRHTGRN